MPANMVKPGEEGKWEKAKEKAKEEYTTGKATKNKKKLSKDRFWAAVASIFKKMTHKENVNDLLKYGDKDDIKFIIEKYISKEEEEILNEYFNDN